MISIRYSRENELRWCQNPTSLSILAHHRIGRLLFIGDYHRRADLSTMASRVIYEFFFVFFQWIVFQWFVHGIVFWRLSVLPRSAVRLNLTKCTIPFGDKHRDFPFGSGNAVVERNAIPFERFLLVRLDAIALLVHDAQDVSGATIALFSRLLIPKRGLLWVTFDTTTFGVHRRQIEFRSTILRQGSPTITLYCHGKLLMDVDASVYQEPDL